MRKFSATKQYPMNKKNKKMYIAIKNCKYNFFFKLGFTSCKTEQPLQDMELQEKDAQKG